MSGFLLLSGCTQNQNEQHGIQIVASFYPLAFFAEEIGGDYITVTQVIPDNTELHAWQPSISDITAASNADILVYNGAHLDHWFEEDILTSIDTTAKFIVETTETVTLLESEAGNGHQDSLYDPHTWVSPFIASQQAEMIYAALVQKDPDHAEYYTQRWTLLQQRFTTIDTEFQEGLSTKQKDTIFVTHAAFGYLAARYGFHQHGVIGLSADEQPSASTIATLVSAMVEHETYVVYVDPVYSDRYAQTLKSTLEAETGQNVHILTLYLMSGAIDTMDYFEQLEKNLENLQIGLQAS
ncbi:MAG: zinc ABC transporter substrate-binding protein [Candidatus Thermoplasmatota archaeon]|nr:zinc ABC transporter substrate-binding protein [Candidatus Thermoplasmatota archaeon]